MENCSVDLGNLLLNSVVLLFKEIVQSDHQSNEKIEIKVCLKSFRVHQFRVSKGY